MAPNGSILDELSAMKDAHIMQAQAIFKNRCSDARDVGALDDRVRTELLREYAARGVIADTFSASIAGNFVTPDVLKEVQSFMRKMLDRYSVNLRDATLDITAQILAHGDVALKPGVEPGKIVYKPEELEIHPGSNVNCGMCHAQEVWEHFARGMIMAGSIGTTPLVAEYFSLADKKHVKTPIDSPGALLALLKDYYYFPGEDPFRFVTSIGDLRFHPLEQKRILRSALDSDLELRNVHVHVNAAIVNYITGFTARVDDNPHVYTFLDDVARMRQVILEDTGALPADDPERLRRGAVQRETVKVGLLCPSGMSAPRTRLAMHMSEEGNSVDVAGGVFAIISRSARVQYAPFGPYEIAAFAYSTSPDGLNLKRFYVLGETGEDIQRMLFKINKDPLVAYIMRKHEVEVRTLKAGDLKGEIREDTDRYRQIVRRKMREYMDSAPSCSPLKLPIVNPRILERRNSTFLPRTG